MSCSKSQKLKKLAIEREWQWLLAAVNESAEIETMRLVCELSRSVLPEEKDAGTQNIQQQQDV